MVFLYVRHGNPIYNPDSLTPLGVRQAEAVCKRLALSRVDRIYASSSIRAQQTAKPLSELLGKPIEELAFATENLAWRDFAPPIAENRCMWAFQNKEYRDLFHSAEVRALGFEWYKAPSLVARYDFSSGMERVYRESDAFFASLGYEHERYTGRYCVIKKNNERVALFAHQGFGLAFLSAVLDIPYPVFCTQFDMCHTGVTKIDFEEENGYAIPRVCTLSDTGHLYREGFPITPDSFFF